MLNDKISYFSNGKYQLQVINNDVYVNNSLLTAAPIFLILSF